MSLGPLASPPASGPCIVCGSTTCAPAPDMDHPESYPFLPGGRPMAQGTEGVDYVITPRTVVDAERNRIVYVANSRVPMDDAIKYGLVEAPPAPAAPVLPKKRAKHGPAEDRARKAAEDRTTP